MPKSVKRKRSAKTKRRYKNRKPTKKLNRKQLKSRNSKSKKSRSSKKKQSGGKNCKDCGLSNGFKDYMEGLRSSLNESKLSGGGYSVDSDGGNFTVIKQYEDNNPPFLVNKKLKNSNC
jgi:hypothetical protein